MGPGRLGAPRRLEVITVDEHGLGPVTDEHAVLLRELLFLPGGAHLLGAAAVDERHFLGAQEVVQGCFLDVVNGPDGALYYSSVSQILRLGR